MKKNGFTLVELLVTMVIIGVVSTIAIIAGIKIREKTLQKNYESKIILAETAAKKYGERNKNEIWNTENGCVNIAIEELIRGGFLKSEEENREVLINPLTSEPMTEIFKICYLCGWCSNIQL